MDVAIKRTIGDQLPREVKELVLDNQCKQAHVSGLDNFDSLEVLSINGCGLTSLSSGFPFLPALRRLELSDNRLTGAGLDKLASNAPRLEVLNLSGNLISNLEALKALGGCMHLRVVDCFRCPVSESRGYREFMFREIRGLSVLDGKDEAGQDVDDEDEDDEDEDEDEAEDDYEEDDEDIREEDAVLKQAYGKTRPGDDDDDDDEDDEDEEDYEDDDDADEEEDYNGDMVTNKHRLAGRSGKAEAASDDNDDDHVGLEYLTGDLEEEDDDDGNDFAYDDDGDGDEDDLEDDNDDDDDDDEDEEEEDHKQASKRQRPG